MRLIRLALSACLMLLGYIIAIPQFEDASASTASSLTQPVTRNEFVPGEVIIKFRDSVPGSLRQSTIQSIGGRTINQIPAFGVYVLQFDNLKRLRDLVGTRDVVNRLSTDPNILYAEPNIIYSKTDVPNDPPLNDAFWAWPWEITGTFTAWDTTEGREFVWIAIIDTGIDMEHPDLREKRILPGGYDFIQDDDYPQDDDGHGTAVAGLAAAVADNNVGIAGVCARCRIMPLKVFDDDGKADTDDILDAMAFAVVRRVQVMNLSLGSYDRSNALEDAVRTTYELGTFITCSAGNENTDDFHYPSSYRGCFSVGATDRDDQRASFSNYGGTVSVAAPGDSIMSLLRGDNRADAWSGTSFSTPFVAGLAGLLSSQGLTNDQITARICVTADRIPNTGTNCGRVNVARAVVTPEPQLPQMNVRIKSTYNVFPLNKPVDIEIEAIDASTGQPVQGHVSMRDGGQFPTNTLFSYAFTTHEECTASQKKCVVFACESDRKPPCQCDEYETIPGACETRSPYGTATVSAPGYASAAVLFNFGSRPLNLSIQLTTSVNPIPADSSVTIRVITTDEQTDEVVQGTVTMAGGSSYATNADFQHSFLTSKRTSTKEECIDYSCETDRKPPCQCNEYADVETCDLQPPSNAARVTVNGYGEKLVYFNIQGTSPNTPTCDSGTENQRAIPNGMPRTGLQQIEGLLIFVTTGLSLISCGWLVRRMVRKYKSQ